MTKKSSRWSRAGHAVAAWDRASAARLAAAHGPVLDQVLPRLGRAADHSRLWLAASAALAAGGRRTARRGALRGLTAIAIASPLVNVAAKSLTRRSRPLADSVPVIRRLTRTPWTSSFPSGHSASAAAFATGVWLEDRRLGPPAAALAGAVAVSRVVTGAHFPSDVLVGVAIGVGAAAATLFWWPNLPFRAARADESPTLAPVPDGAGVEIVVNAGAGTVEDGLADRLREALPLANVVEAGGDGIEEALAAAARRGTVLGIAGGDGSARAAAHHARENGIPLLLIPAGTHNHLASDLGLTTVEDALGALAAGTAVRIDLAYAGDRVFLNTCAAGLYTDMVVAREHFEAGLGHWPALALGCLKAFATGTPQNVVVNGRRRRLWVFFAGNGRYGPRGFVPAYRRDLADGIVDVRLVDAHPLGRLRLVTTMAFGALSRSRVYTAAAVRGLRLEPLDGSLVLSLDGEPHSFDGAVTVGKAGDRLTVYRPAPAAEPPARG